MNEADEQDFSGGPIREYSASVAICIPAGDTLMTNFAYDLARMMATTAQLRPDIKQILLTCKGSLIPKQRERLVADTLTTDATHLLFLDSDMRFPKDTIVRLLSRDVEAVCANYHERSAPHRPVAFKTFEDFRIRVWTLAESVGLEPIAACGCGVMMVRTELLRRLEMPRFAVAYKKDSEGFVGEDIWFCQQMMKAGATVYLDHDLSKEVRHLASLELWPHECVEWGRENGELPKLEPVGPKLVIDDAAVVAGLLAAEDYEPALNAAVEGA